MRTSRMATNGKPPLVNLDANERLASLVAGLVLGIYALIRLPTSVLLALLGGGYLLYRALSGHCYVYEALGINRAVPAYRPGRPQSDEPLPPGIEDDLVNEAAWQSFPASDPPPWTLGE